jgi:hypothetical protein
MGSTLAITRPTTTRTTTTKRNFTALPRVGFMGTFIAFEEGGVRRGKELPGKGYYPGITLEERIRMKKRTKARMSNIRLRALTGRQEA